LQDVSINFVINNIVNTLNEKVKISDQCFDNILKNTPRYNERVNITQVIKVMHQFGFKFTQDHFERLTLNRLYIEDYKKYGFKIDNKLKKKCKNNNDSFIYEEIKDGMGKCDLEKNINKLNIKEIENILKEKKIKINDKMLEKLCIEGKFDYITPFSVKNGTLLSKKKMSPTFTYFKKCVIVLFRACYYLTTLIRWLATFIILI
jgi:hypothetical protein